MKGSSAGLDIPHSVALVGLTLCIYHGRAVFLPFVAILLDVSLLLAVLTSHIAVRGPVISIGAGRGFSVGGVEQGGLSLLGADGIDDLNLIVFVLAGRGAVFLNGGHRQGLGGIVVLLDDPSLPHPHRWLGNWLRCIS